MNKNYSIPADMSDQLNLVPVDMSDQLNADLAAGSTKMTKGISSATLRGRKVVIFIRDSRLMMVHLKDPTNPDSSVISMMLAKDCKATYFKIYVSESGITCIAQDDTNKLYIIQVRDDDTQMILFDVGFKVDHILLSTAIGNNQSLLVSGIYLDELSFFLIDMIMNDDGSTVIRFPETRVTLPDHENIEIIVMMIVNIEGKTYYSSAIHRKNKTGVTKDILLLFDTDKYGKMTYDVIDIDNNESLKGLKKFIKTM